MQYLRSAVLASAALTAALSLPAQTILPGPGKYMASVTVKVYVAGKLSHYKGEMYLIDPLTLKAQALTLPSFLGKVGLNSITEISPVMGYVTTIDGAPGTSPPSRGDLYRYILAGTKANLTKLNTKPFTGGNLAQVAQIGADLYVCSQDSANQNGYLWSVPVLGGAPKLLVDFNKIPGYAGLANALTVFNGKLYLATWPSGKPTKNQLWEYDPAAKKITKVMELPKGLYSTYVYPVHLTVDQKRRTLVLIGLYRDIVHIDPVTKKVVQYMAGNHRTSTGKPYYYNFLNSGTYNPDTGDIALGTRRGGMDLLTGSHGALDLVPGVGSGPKSYHNSVTGLAYFPVGGHCVTYGDGGLGSPAAATYRFWPIQVNLGLPMAGGSFGFHLHNATGGAPALLFLGVSKSSWGGIPLPFDLGLLGAPGNFLRCSGEAILTLTAAGRGPGKGKAEVRIPSIPLSARGSTLYSQWLILDQGANALGLVVSNARESLVR